MTAPYIPSIAPRQHVVPSKLVEAAENPLAVTIPGWKQRAALRAFQQNKAQRRAATPALNGFNVTDEDILELTAVTVSGRPLKTKAD